jgi:hypothetical protein
VLIPPPDKNTADGQEGWPSAGDKLLGLCVYVGVWPVSDLHLITLTFSINLKKPSINFVLHSRVTSQMIKKVGKMPAIQSKNKDVIDLERYKEGHKSATNVTIKRMD